MSEPANFKVRIPEPCHEDWTKMQPESNGRFCNSCSKVVVDFTAFTDEELLAYFQNTQSSICGRIHSHKLAPEKQSIIPRIASWSKWALAFVMATLFSKSHAQSSVEVFAISGPGSEPVFDQQATDTTFKFTLIGGALSRDSGIQYITVKRDIDVFEFERRPDGTFDIQIPRVWHDSVFNFTFFNKRKRLVGTFDIPLKDAWKYADSKVDFKSLPTASIVAADPGKVVRQGVMVGAMSVVNYGYYRVMPSNNGIYPVNLDFNGNQGKIPVHIPGKVLNGSQDLPGMPNVPASELPKY